MKNESGVTEGTEKHVECLELLSNVIMRVIEIPKTRKLSIVVTKLEEAYMWLDREIKDYELAKMLDDGKL